MSNITKLKIKLKHLATEPAIIKLEERRARYNADRESYYNHRINVVRPAARATQLAYAFLRGKKYKTLEHNEPLKTQANTYIGRKVLTQMAMMIDNYGDVEKHFTEGQVKDIRQAPFDKKRDIRREYIRKYLHATWINVE